MKYRYFDIVASVVTFNNPISILDQLHKSFINTKLNVKLIFIDNSSNPEIEKFSNENKIEYIVGHGNVGFGAGHNIAINLHGNESKYFLILNPDIIINEGCLDALFDFMESHQQVPLISPLILNSDGSIQFVNRRLPTLKILFFRRFFSKYFEAKYKDDLDYYILKDQLPFDRPLVVPIITGCFMFFRGSALKELNGFDERFFLYVEDFDISRRSSRLGPNVFYPHVSVQHLWERGPHKKLRLLWINIKSIWSYYCKWGFRVDGVDSKVSRFE